jgi:hypothetical protein
MPSSSSGQSKSSHKFRKILFLCHFNNMSMHTALQKTRLWSKKWATLPCNHPWGLKALKFEGDELKWQTLLLKL